MAFGRQDRDSTQLIQRQARATGGSILFRVGAYDVLRGLVRAPGAWLVEGRGPTGEAVLLQLVHCRNAPVGHRLRFEQLIAARTADLLDTDDLTVMAHGSAPREDGSRVMFWALPWPAEGDRLADAARFVESPGHLLVVGRQLADRLVERSARGCFDPLLSEQTVLVRPEGAQVVGVPVAVPRGELTDDMKPARLAPEEEAGGHATGPGDVWRLGHALIALSAAFETVPEQLSTMLERMTRQDPSARPSASEVSAALRALMANLDRAGFRPAADPAITEHQAPSPDIVSQLIVSHLGDSTVVPAPLPQADEPRTVEGLDPPVVDPVTQLDLEAAGPPASSEADTTAPDEPIRVPDWAFFFDGPQFHRFIRRVQRELDARNLPFNVSTGVVERPGSGPADVRRFGIAELARACHQSPALRWPELITNALDRRLADEELTRPSSRERAAAGPDAEITVNSAPFRPPLTRPLIDPAEAPPTRRAVLARGATEPLVVEVAPPAASDLAARLAPSPRRPAWAERGRLAAGFVIGVLVGAWATSSPAPHPPATDTTVTAVSPANEVVVDADPPSAVVVSERDGQVLGPVPVTLMIPPGLEIAVLVAAEGYEPQRLVLPSRGSISTRLLRLPPEVAPCTIALPPGQRSSFEGVQARVESDGQLIVWGAAVVRSKDRSGPRAGAWAVRCPRFGGQEAVRLQQPPLRPTRISVGGPAGAVAYLNDQRLGPVPAEGTASAAFTKVGLRAEGRMVSRWVPTASEVSVRLSFDNQ